MISTNSYTQLFAWLNSFRPKTLPLAFAAIILGVALASRYAAFQANIAVLSLLTASLLQILSNVANDYGDTLKGADNNQRQGPLRAIHQGLLQLKDLYLALWILVLLCAVSGGLLLYLSYSDMQSLFVYLLLGALAIVAAITYTVGRKAYGYYGLGDISVLIFFGFLAVAGSFYLQVNYWHYEILLPACASGLLAVVVLNLNNLRDIKTDKKAGKITLAVRLGVVKTRYYHLLLTVLAWLFFSIYLFYWVGYLAFFCWFLIVPYYIYHVKVVFQQENLSLLLLEGVRLNIISHIFYVLLLTV